MIFEAFAIDSAKLSSLPETGMGYQVIEAKPIGEQIKKKYVVYNEQMIVDLDSNFEFNKRTINIKGFSTALREANFLALDRDSISLIPKSLIIETRFLSETKKKSSHRYSGGRGAKDNAKENASGIETFVRVSAYENDNRIDFENKKLKDGSYTTTLLDYLDCVNYQDDPLDRYALPNEETIKWAFYILPKAPDSLQRGIVQPAFKHDGGGIEAYFENGTSNKSYFDKRTYGK